MTGVNIWAVLVAAIASMAIGSVWYGPLFGKVFTHALGMGEWSQEKRDSMKKGMAMMYVSQFIASLVMFYVLAMFMGATGHSGVGDGVFIAFWAWLGFIVPLKFGDELWGGKMKLFWLGIGNSLITLLVGAAILGALR
jgi:hypothetical protein